MIEIKPKKPVAKMWLSYVVAVIYMVIGVCGILFVVSLVRGNHKLSIYTLGISVGLILICFILSQVLAWYASERVYTDKGKFVYEMYCEGDYIGRNKSVYKCTEITRYKKKGKNLRIWGTIEAKEVLGRARIIKHTDILDGNREDVIKLVEDFRGAQKEGR